MWVRGALLFLVSFGSVHAEDFKPDYSALPSNNPPQIEPAPDPAFDFVPPPKPWTYKPFINLVPIPQQKLVTSLSSPTAQRLRPRQAGIAQLELLKLILDEAEIDFRQAKAEASYAGKEATAMAEQAADYAGLYRTKSISLGPLEVAEHEKRLSDIRARESESRVTESQAIVQMLRLSVMEAEGYRVSPKSLEAAASKVREARLARYRARDEALKLDVDFHQADALANEALKPHRAVTSTEARTTSLRLQKAKLERESVRDVVERLEAK